MQRNTGAAPLMFLEVSNVANSEPIPIELGLK
jgi:hypothetical protein